MTEEAKATVTAEDTVETITEKTETEKPEPEKTQKKEPDGTDFIDFAKIPADIRDVVETRFKRLYGHVKSLERDRDLGRDHSMAMQKRLEELTAIVDAGQNNATAKQIKEQLVAAKQRGDVTAEVELTDRLTRINASPKQTQPLPQLPPPETGDMAIAKAWESEIGEDGNFKRPWAQRDHPDFGRAMNLARSLSGDVTIGTDINLVLAEVDRRMGLKQPQPKRQRDANVMTSDTRPPKGELPELTPEQKNIARKMGIPPQDYAKQLKLIQGAAR